MTGRPQPPTRRTPGFYDQRLLGPFGPGALAAFREYLARPDSPELTRTAARRLRRALSWRAFCRHPLRVPATKVVALGRRLRRLLRPPGIMIAVMGTDPVTRSAVIARIRPVLAAAVLGHVHLRQLRPGLLPGMGHSRGGLNSEVPAPGSQPRGLLDSLRSLFRLAYCALDCALGYWATIYPSLVKKPCVWIFDCYFDDRLVPATGRRKSLPQWVVNVLAVAVPKPDVVISLAAGLEDRQALDKRGRYREDSRVVWADTKGTPEDSADRVLSAIVARASARYRQSQMP